MAKNYILKNTSAEKVFEPHNGASLEPLEQKAFPQDTAERFLVTRPDCVKLIGAEEEAQEQTKEE